MRGTARALLASVLLATFMAGVVPLASVAAGSTCQLECCAGRAPHASGSCMGGSCEAVLSKARAQNRHKLNPADEFCGRPITFKSTRFTPGRIEGSSHQASDRISQAAFEQPCQPDCGGCVSGFTNSNRHRNSAAIAEAHRPRPPTGARLTGSGYLCIQTLPALSQQGAPRGPPFSLS
jgi:hypothetical protein